MGNWFDGPLPPAAVLALVAGLVAVGLALLAIRSLRRAARRLTSRVVDLRLHPLVGDLPADDDPALRSLALEFNRLLADLRGRVGAARGSSTGLDVLADGPPDVVLIGLDDAYRVVAFGRGAAGLTGWEAAEIQDRHVEILFAPGEWERILPKLARRSLRVAGISETVRLQRRDGASLPARLSLAAAAMPGGGDGLLLAAWDITEQSGLEHRLRESEERYRRLVEGIGDGVFIVRADRLVYANPALARMLGAERDALLGMPFRDLIHARDVLRVAEVVRRAEAGEEATGEIGCLLARGDGPPIDARLTWSVIDFEGGRAVIGTVSDLTGQTRVARALAESEARLQATLNAIDNGILLLGESPRGPVVAVANPAFGRLFGLDSGAILGRPETELRRALAERCKTPEGLEAFLAAARAGEEAQASGLEVARPGRAILDLAAAPVRSASGEKLGVIVTARDVTARVESERGLREGLDELTLAKADLEAAYRDLAEAQKTLAQRNEQLEKLNAELKSLDEMKSNLLANVSHELHTPLVSIKGYTEMILKRRLGPLTPEQERGLGVALKNIDRLVEMIDNLLSFSRMEKGETQLNLETAPVWQLIDEAVELVGERIKKKNISVTTQYEADDLLVRADRGKIVQVLTNLLTNAVKFNREGGRITLTARKGARGFVEVEVADTGIGVPPEAIEKIFERFYQADSGASRRYEGTGIGLSIVRDILRLHGCSIGVRSEPGQGSAFTFTLPLAREAEPSPARPPAGRGRARE